jgi:antirestriction protein ArdC
MTNKATSRQDIYTRVTNKIIADLEKGDLTWLKPWNADHLGERITKPLRHNGLPYQGMNIILLWAASVEQGYVSNRWMTFRQARELGGHVRKGEHGETVVYADKMVRSETDPDTGDEVEYAIPFMKAYTVFNVEQIEDLPAHFYAKPQPLNPDIERDDALEAFFGATGADIRHGGTQAYYALQPDYVQVPYLECFRDRESYYATLAHEMTHWTRHPSRLDRDFGRKRYGDEGYAREELVAEIGAAFLCAELGITPEVREDHAAYIESWLTVLKKDKRAVFSAAAHAQRAVDYLQSYQQRETCAA